MSQSEWENLASLVSLGVGGIAAVVLLTGVVPSRWIVEIDRRFHRCANRPWLVAIALAAVSIAVNSLIAIHNGIPQPTVHDESSYLLAADTFAHGRITNPTPLFPAHFETPQQLMVPSYMSKYFPGQGMFLAAGQLLTGQPIAGAWFSTAAAVMAIYWMLLGFFSKPWSLLGGIIAALHPQMLDWSQTYWGGSVAVLGSALFIGAWGRLMITVERRAAVMLALGILVLANSRPFEGSLVIVPLMIALLFRIGKQLRSLVIPVGIPLFLGAVAMGYYNFRITGHMLRLPYLQYAREYEIYPKFWFLPAGPMRNYANPAMAYVHRDFEHLAYICFSTVPKAIDNTRYRFNLLFSALLNQAILLLPLAAALLARKPSRLRWIAGMAAVFIVGMWTETFVYSHYLAPLLPALMLLIVFGWRWIDRSPGQPTRWQFARWQFVGQSVARACLIGFVAGAILCAVQPASRDPDMLDQQSVIQQLPQLQAGRHLVLVKYAPMHSYHSELVHNLSDLDGSRVLWVRSLGSDADRQIAGHYKDRQVWLLNVGGKLDLKPFPLLAGKN